MLREASRTRLHRVLEAIGGVWTLWENDMVLCALDAQGII